MKPKLTKDLKQLRADAWNSYQELLKVVGVHKYTFLIIGKLLYDMRERELYKYIGDGGNETFDQFLQNSETGLAVSTAKNYMDVYRYYILQLGMPEAEVAAIPPYRLNDLKGELKKRPDEEAVEIIKNMTPLTHADFRRARRENDLDSPYPEFWKDKETGKWILLFKPEQILFIKNTIDDTYVLDNREKPTV